MPSLPESIFLNGRKFLSVTVTELSAGKAGRAEADTEIVLTGRNANPKIVEIAHLVSEIKPIKHYWDTGIAARKGIEY